MKILTKILAKRKFDKDVQELFDEVREFIKEVDEHSLICNDPISIIIVGKIERKLRYYQRRLQILHISIYQQDTDSRNLIFSINSLQADLNNISRRLEITSRSLKFVKIPYEYLQHVPVDTAVREWLVRNSDLVNDKTLQDPEYLERQKSVQELIKEVKDERHITPMKDQDVDESNS